MPIQIEVIEEGFVLHYMISDPWDVPELLKTFEEERAYRDSVSHVVHSINDFSGARKIPANWWSARQGPGLTHPRSGEMVFIGLTPGFRLLLDAILKATRYKRVKVFNTADDGWEYIRHLAARSKLENPLTVRQ